ncbi:kinesin-like protein at 67A isoform X2 [Lycorma delicatula]|uniref:kinesin-like protein at 67A isoform X2 n=1 Tax=Lycorma delicatula TaxID=130591 RepID=UPI003F511320
MQKLTVMDTTDNEEITKMALKRKDLEKAFPPLNKSRKLSRLNSMTDPFSSNTNISNMNVFVRVRPPNQREMQENFRNVVKVVDDKLLIFDPKEDDQPFFFHGTRQKTRDMTKKQNKQMDFLFDGVFGSDKTNLDVHIHTTHSIIGKLLEGYNCSVFVYGATGAGKTHTMLGNRDNPGIMYHTMAELYNQIEQMAEERECHVGVSFVEVYNENVHNLLHPSGPMHLREDSNGVTVAGLKVEDIFNAEQLLEKLAEGNMNRTQHPTDANAESSRSHAVFQVYVRMVARADGQVKIVKLSMIDLAGSERGMATGCKGLRFKEGSNINKSLLALGNCISSLADGLRHIPYRDSKLTRLLKDSLGGNCQTVMIANVSPSSASYEDTYNTLKYATRAKKIKTKLTKNIMSVDMHISHYVKLVEELKKENMVLQSQVRALELTVADSGRKSSQIPDLTVWCNHLNSLFDEKIKLHVRLLKIKSEANVLNWRIKHKKEIENIIENSRSGLSNEMSLVRIESSIKQFEARLHVIQPRLSELNNLLSSTNEKLKELFIEMQEARVFHYMDKEIAVKNSMLHRAEQNICLKHLTRLLKLQQKRDDNSEAAHRLMETLLNEYHKVLSGMNQITNNMQTSYENAIRMLEGIKTVSWCDVEIEDTDISDVHFLVDLTVDDSIFPLNDQSLKLKPTVLPITTEEEEENEITCENGNVCNSELNNINDEKKEADDCVSSINNDCNVTEMINDVGDVTVVIDSTPMPTLRSVNSSVLSNSSTNILNETITLEADDAPTTLPSKKKDNVNLMFVKAKKKTFILPRPPIDTNTSFNKLKKINKENIINTNGLLKNNIRSVKEIGFKKPVAKTPLPGRFNRAVLVSKPINVQQISPKTMTAPQER